MTYPCNVFVIPVKTGIQSIIDKLFHNLFVILGLDPGIYIIFLWIPASAGMTYPLKLLIATHNPAKKQELKEGFSSLDTVKINLLFLDNLKISDDPEETGKTFLENARLKAHYFAGISGLPTVADDGGIEIDALNGQPGVHSKRWLGRNATDEELITYTLKRLNEVGVVRAQPQQIVNRTAQFTVCLAYRNPITGCEASVTESLRGHIALSPSGHARKGFPYRALFVVDAYNKYYDELTEQEHHAVNHRLRAVKKLIPLISEDLLQ